MDREFAQVLYRALMLIVAYLEARYGFGKAERRGRSADVIPRNDTT